MAFLARFLLAAAFLSAAAGCSTVVENYTSAEAPTAAAVQQGRAHVYLIRGLMGQMFSRGLDTLAEKIIRMGIPATVHTTYTVGSLADEVAANYRSDPGPIILIGHSTGGDVAVAVAKRLREEKIPVGMIVGLDPTPLAGDVPENVELCINLFQKMNPAGGGRIKAGHGFEGRLINIDLRENSGLMYANLDTSSRVQDIIVNEIVGYVSRSAVVPRENFIRPFSLEYIVPPNELIQVWDSGVSVRPAPGDNVGSIAESYRVPAWLLAQVNRLDPNQDIESGKRLVVPQHMYAEPTSSGAGLSTYR